MSLLQQPGINLSILNSRSCQYHIAQDVAHCEGVGFLPTGCRSFSTTIYTMLHNDWHRIPLGNYPAGVSF